MTALHVAAAHGMSHMVDFFIGLGADINNSTREGESAICDLTAQ